MSEVLSRPAARGRGSGRGGRGGGHSTRGGSRIASRTAVPNGDSKHDTDSALPTLEDEGEIGQLKKQYGSKVGPIKEIYPDWSDVDILYALQETEGDENLAVARIVEGSITQWGEVSKTRKERVRPKGKNDTFTTTTAESAPSGGLRPTRGGRIEGGRGGRGRATERGGRGGARGKSIVATTNGTRTKDTAQLSVPTEESSEWNNTKPTDDWETPVPEPAAAETTPSAPVAAVSAVPKPPASTDNAPKTWASMLRQSTAPKPAPKPKETPAPKPTEAVIEPLPPAAEPAPVEPEPEPFVDTEPAPVELEEKPSLPTPPPPAVPTVVVPEVALLPSKDQLTETNLEQIIDESKPAPTGTARSEATDSWDPRVQALSATATPLSASQQQHQPARAVASGYAATATKATERAATRTPSHTRRILEQREAVRMPGNRDQVDRAAVQFGAFSLNDEDDIDGDREEPETRPQPPEDSPVAHPRTSLPPIQPAPVPEAFPAQKPATALPPTGPAASTPTAPQVAPSAPSQAVQPPTAPSAQQFGRFGPTAPQEPAPFPASKPFDSFAQQQPSASAAQSQFESGFPGQAQPAQPQTQQQPGGAFSSAPGEFSAYYTADAQSRGYNNYYNNQNFGQQSGAQTQQEALSSQPQRSFSGYNTAQNDSLSQYPQSGVQHAQSGRFGSVTGADAQASATPTPNQAVAPGQAAQTTQGQSHGQQPHEGYPYNGHPYYANQYYSGYMGYGSQGAYNAGYGAPYGKGGLGYQANQYGMSPQGPHAYGSSPAGGFGQSALHRESAAGAGLGDYSRAGPGQSASSGFGGMHDAFGRGASAYQSQSGQSFNAAGPQPGSGPSAADDLKPFGDAKGASGPSPSLTAAARPGSAANNAPSQSGLPPPQSSQQGGLSGIGGYGGYPSHLQGHNLHGTQSGAGGYGMSASGGQGQGQGHQNSYGGYGGQGFGGSYYQNPPRGWGNNYH
ncbi:hypothetical protein B0T16DRAFT_457752 [Cercophora newfieldiana]|uniref:RNA polymerase II degradation factor 1 n=1 Tax=Cercophora newfieldiana TaxID=92897 RepID=A0AA39Y4V2_9PEZI|nr:hypothetical protein B0T16DRAFT_457752 [Cercophora newfieldiana]